MTNPKWEIGPVELIGGCEAIIDAINEDQEDFRYSGRVRGQLGIMVSVGWHANGRYMYADTDCGFSLAPPPKKTVRVQLWVNVNPKSYVVYYTRDMADKNAQLNRIACKEIDIEATEGEGL